MINSFTTKKIKKSQPSNTIQHWSETQPNCKRTKRKKTAEKMITKFVKNVTFKTTGFKFINIINQLIFKNYF